MRLKNQNQNFLKLSLLVLAVLFTAVSCNLPGVGGGGGKPRVELTWWKTFDTEEQVRPLVEEFQKSFPNIHIKFVPKNIETYEDELVNALASGSGPDIFTIHNDWLPTHKDKLFPAPESIFTLRDLRDNFAEIASVELVGEGKVYAVPLALDVLAMYYNKDILSSVGIARPPATWEELVEDTPKITRQDQVGNFQRQAVALGTADHINRAPDILELLMLQNGTLIYSEDKRTAIFDQTARDSNNSLYSPGVRALEFYTQFADPAKVTYTWNNRSNNSIEAFAAGKVAMIFSYSYLRATLADKAPFLNYGVAPMPQLAGSLNRINFANYWAEGVAKQSQHPQEAWQFLKFVTDSKNLPKYYEVQKQVAPRIDILEKQIPDTDIGVFAENALSAKTFYKPDSDAVESILVQMINDVVLHNVSPPEAVAAAAQKFNLILRSL